LKRQGGAGFVDRAAELRAFYRSKQEASITVREEIHEICEMNQALVFMVLYYLQKYAVI
jgi:hypothetical protein